MNSSTAHAAPPHTLTSLRAMYPEFTYESFRIEEANDALTITFAFRTGAIRFAPRITLPLGSVRPSGNFATLAFHIGLIESISYWKATCSPKIVVAAGQLDTAQKKWWRTLLLKGMGEYFYRNDIDFSGDDFITIEAQGPALPEAIPLSAPSAADQGALLFIAGGKDSSLALEMLRHQPPERIVPLSLNATRSAIDSARIAGHPAMLSPVRTIDPRLLELNAQGFLNGHTPFSAYLAFLGAAVASLHGMRRVIVCNEGSANEGNVTFHGMEVNHQYSKSLDFEQRFRAYCHRYLNPQIDYFSFFRPLSDLQVSALFSRYPEQLRSFRSCNVGQKSDRWCGHCPKCAFVYLSLFPFLGSAQACSIFGADLFANTEIIGHIRGLVGSDPVKPFECVGSIAESREALYRSSKRIEQEGNELPRALQELLRELRYAPQHSLLQSWSNEHFLPTPYEQLLRSAVRELGNT